MDRQEDASQEAEQLERGVLYVVATPVGNRSDMSIRALEVLRQVDCIACEDTRVSARLLDHYEISAQRIAYHEHNEQQMAEQLCARLEGGETIALVSDAGTPNISDPGFRVVRACRRAGVPVIAIPGPCALVLALCASGLPTHQFFFAGFLPPKKAARQRFFEENSEVSHSLVIYESRHRIQKFMDDLIAVLGEERYVSIAREMTKLHETHLVGEASSVREQLIGVQLKGEFVVVIAPRGYTL